MSLSRTIFSLPPDQQKEAIMSLARKALLRGRELAGSARDEFDKLKTQATEFEELRRTKLKREPTGANPQCRRERDT